MKQLILIIFLLFNIVSCKKEPETITQLVINLDQATPFKASEWYSNINYVPLDNQAKALLKTSDWMVKISEDKIYLLDEVRPLKKVLKIYDSKGKWETTINKEESGPGVFYGVNDFLIDEKSKEIELLDGASRKLVKYSTDGIFIKNELLADDYLLFSKFSDKEYVFHAGNIPFNRANHNLYFADPTRVRSSYINIPDILVNQTYVKNHFSEPDAQGSRLYFTPFSSKIYLLKDFDHPPTLLLDIDFGKDWHGKLDLPTDIEIADRNKASNKAAKVSNFRFAALYGDLVFLQFYAGRQLYFCWIDTRKNKLIKLSNLYARSNTTNDLDGGPTPLKFHSSYHNELLTIHDAHKFKFYFEQKKIEESNPNFKKFKLLKILADSLDYESNPILVKAELILPQQS